MQEGAYIPYAPLDTPKPFAEDIWIVDGPEIGMHYFGLTLPFPTRMTVVRMPDGKVWVHSPIAWNDSLGAAIDRLGSVCYLVAPNTLHYSYFADWQARYPQAHSYGPPGLAGRDAKPAIGDVLGKDPPAEWGDAFGQCLVPGTLITEVDFFHRASRTLILTDLIENFEPSRVRNRLLRWTMQAFGAASPDGKAPIDMQLSFIRHRPAVREAARQMIAWAPERIVCRCKVEMSWHAQSRGGTGAYAGRCARRLKVVHRTRPARRTTPLAVRKRCLPRLHVRQNL